MRRTNATLELRYILDGELQRLLIPPESAPRRTDKLWQHTCFEAFIRSDRDRGYYEFNFSPSTEWAIYRFSGYREGMAVVAAAPPRIGVQRGPESLAVGVDVDLGSLPDLSEQSELRMSLCAVIEEVGPRLSYWAIVHPADKPDFHHADGFALTLASTRSRA